MSRKSSVGVDALGEEVHRQGHDVDVAGPLAVAEEGALDAVRAGQHGQLRRGHGGAAVVVRVQAQHDAVAVLDGAAEPLDDVGVDVRAVHLHGGGEVEDDRPLGRRLDHVHHRFADLHGVVGLGAGETFRRVLVADLRARHLRLVLLAELGRLYRDVGDAGLVHSEHHAALQLGHRVVEVHDGAPRADERLEGALDQLLPALHEHLDLDVVGDQVLVNDQALEVVVGLGGRGEPDLDLLEPDVDQGLEQRELALGVHRVDEGLVAVAQVDAGPAWRVVELAVGPGPVVQDQRHVRSVLVEGHGRRIAGQGQATPLHVVTTPFLLLCHLSVPSLRPYAQYDVPFRSGISGSGHLIDFIVIALVVREGQFGSCRCRPNKKPPGRVAQEVAGERDVTFAVR